MKIKIDPADTLFFRDGKPFTGGEETWADAIFPPYPPVIYGALRSKFFSVHITDLIKADEPNDPTSILKIKCIVLQSGKRLLFPMPLDCVKKKGDKSTSAFVLKTGERTETSNCPLENVLVAEKNTVAESVEDGLLDDIFLKSYLAGEESVHYVKLSDYMVSEPKIGIRRNNRTHSAEAGMLYRIEMKRLESAKKPGKKTQSISLFAEFEGLTLPEKGFLKLGGEGKSAYYSPSAAGLIDKLELGGNRFKLYLAAPAVFEKGWLPRMIDENTFTGKFNDLEFQLETAVIGKPLHIGGFDMKKKKPKPMRKAVPAGSIYFFTMIKGNIQAAVDAFHGRNISDYEPHQGFGLSFVGGWK